MTGPVRTPVLLMAYGSAPSLAEADVRAYLEHVLQHYRRVSPTPEEVAGLRARYEAVGGSPLYAITERVARGVEAALNRASPGAYAVRWAMKHSPPYVEDAARSIADEGHDRAIGVALAPFRSRLSTEGYYRLAEAANPNGRIAWRFAADWHLDEGFLALWHERIQEALARASSDAVLILTNHSLPARILDWNDPYPAQFTATAEALALRLGRDAWSTAYQSAGGGDAPWLGPRLFEVVATWMDRGRTEFVVAPIGFLMDHLEVLYDLDVEAARMARELRISIYRTRMPNDDPALVELLARQILLAG